MKKFPDNDAFKKINKLVFEFNKRLSYPWIHGLCILMILKVS